MSELWPHTGVVLVGGQNRRMGAEKADLRLPSGLTMLESTISVLSQVCAHTVVVGGKGQSGPAITDLRVGHGPLGGIEALLASGIDDEFLVVPTDMPYLNPELLRRLIRPTDAIATLFAIAGDTRTQSLPLRISADALELVTVSLDSERRELHLLLGELEVTTVPLGEEEAQRVLVNVNDVTAYRSLWNRPDASGGRAPDSLPIL